MLPDEDATKQHSDPCPEPHYPYEEPTTFRASQQIDALATALAEAQKEMALATKNAANPFFGSNYADLGEVMKVCRPVLAKNGIAIIQAPFSKGSTVELVTRLMHKSGQWIECLTIGTAITKPSRKEREAGEKPEKTEDPQAIGSVITYLRRYALSAMAGVATEDDDGEGAVGRGGGRRNGEQGPPPQSNRGGGQRKPQGRNKGEKLPPPVVEAILTAFKDKNITKEKLEEKVSKKTGDWTEDERHVLLQAHQSIEDGKSIEEIFGQDIPEPKEESGDGNSEAPSKS